MTKLSSSGAELGRALGPCRASGRIASIHELPRRGILGNSASDMRRSRKLEHKRRPGLLRALAFWTYELSDLSHGTPRMDPFVLVPAYMAVVNQQGDEDH